MKRISRSPIAIAAVIVLSVCLLAFVFTALSPVQTARADPPQPGTVRGSWQTFTFANAKVFTNTYAVTYTNAPLNVQGTDYSNAAYWYQADAFVTVKLGAGAAVTLTPQFSNDQVNWADEFYNYPSNTFTGASTSTITNTAVVTTSTSITGAMTSSLTGATSIATGHHSLVFSSAGTSYMQFPIAGTYLRYSIASTGTVTLTLRTTYKNSGGQ